MMTTSQLEAREKELSLLWQMESLAPDEWEKEWKQAIEMRREREGKS